MKLFLKTLLLLAVVLAAVYASSPWWIPPILAKQLPDDWQLETLKISWPGTSGINVQHVKANGQLSGMTVSVEAQNSRLSYQGLATEVEAAVLHVYLASANEKPTQPLSIDDLSLPMFHLSANLPALTVQKTQLALHLANDIEGMKSGQPIVFDMQGFSLVPADQGHYQFDTVASIVGQERIKGHINVAVSPGKLLGHIRFPADTDLAPWLNLEFIQQDQPAKSMFKLLFDAGASDDLWMNELLSNSTNGRLTHVNGQLEADAYFDGEQDTHLRQLVLGSDHFEVVFDGTKLIADASLQAAREGQTVNIQFTDEANATFSLLDQSGKIENAVAAAIPELVRSTEASPEAVASTVFTLTAATGLTLTLPENGTTNPSLNVNGGLDAEYTSPSSHILLNASNLNLVIANTDQPDKMELSSDIALNWTESLPFSFNNETLSISSKSLSLITNGKLDWDAESLRFQPSGAFDTHLTEMNAKMQTGEPPTPGWIAMTADDLKINDAKLGLDLTVSDTDRKTNFRFNGPLNASMPKITISSSGSQLQTVISALEFSTTAELISEENRLSSSGDGYLNKPKVMPLAVSATQLEVTWTGLDLNNLTGAVGAKTRELKVKFDEQTWTGFDLDTDLKLEKNDVINGSANLAFNSGTAMPLRFSGGLTSGSWDVDLIKSTLPLAEMRSILRSAKVEIPAELNLVGGTIDVAGHIQVNDEISAKLDLSGADIAADLAESNAQQTSFNFVAGYQQDIYATGPIAIKKMGLAGGIDITDISAGLKVQNDHTFGLSELSAELFDGQLNVSELNYASSEIEDTTINLTHINLQKLLAFLDVDGLQGTGFIDFSLPAGSKGAAIHIVDGTFTATEPGRLSYSKGDMASTNIGLQALDNFHYKKLSGKIAYDSTGPYQITIHLEGNNPDLYNGYPLVFNLTINGSLPELFEAMFLTGSFEDSILKQVNMKKSP